ncbi:MAG: hypothetical protein L0332_13915 [Chloroflexi bacterium]|nr:hypothetical protein [Chloroflexota bacterium]MCI0647339.1 hypothetical protein [Chloroflexota bacterium]MCI0727799.1 hypothetical protein [Chloroflexota bacterium]
MGASGWAYYIPFDPDISKALQQLKERVFKAGDYLSIYTKAELMDYLVKELLVLENTNPRSDSEESLFEEYLTHFKQLKSLPEPTTIEEQIRELLAVNRENGSHSILDINGISPKPGFGLAAPLSEQELLNLFGTDKPTEEMIKSQENVLMDLRSRWEATYVIVYKDGEPEWIYFCGFSGD